MPSAQASAGPNGDRQSNPGATPRGSGDALALRQTAKRQVQGTIERLLRLQQSRRVHGELMSAAGTQLSQPAVVLLNRLHAQTGMTIGELARLTHMDMSLVSRELRRLEGEGLLARTADANDGRVSRVALTASGRGVVRRLRRVRDAHLDETLAHWSDADLVLLGDLMSRFVEDMQSRHYHEQSGAAADEAG